MNQLRQIAGMRGLMANTSGNAVEIPIKSCFREGLDVLEYFISSHGARKGLADTALRTADSGYLTRRLVDVSQDIIVREHDCGTTEYIEVEDIKDGNQIIEKLHERLVGRYPAENIINEATGETIVDTETLITPDIADKVSTPLDNVQNITMYGDKTTELIENNTQKIDKVLNVAKDSLGIDIKELLGKFSNKVTKEE